MITSLNGVKDNQNVKIPKEKLQTNRNKETSWDYNALGKKWVLINFDFFILEIWVLNFRKLYW